MKKSTLDGIFDICKKCGKKIRYDKSDGYWDNQVNEKEWTPFNCDPEDTSHEPINHVSDEKGYYHPIKKVSPQR